MDNPGFDDIELKGDHIVVDNKQHGEAVQDNGYTKSAKGGENQGTEDSYKERFGWGKFRPDFLQFLGGIKGMTFLLAVGGVVQAMTQGSLIGSTISTLEKRYQLPSSKSGLIKTIYHVLWAITSLIFTYVIKTRQGKIKSIAVGALTLGIGSFLYSLPHFLVGMYNYGEAVSAICDPASNSTFANCVEEQRGLSEFLYLFLFAQAMSAFGSMSLFIFASDILESTAPPGTGGFYLGITFAVRGASGAIGFILAGQCLDTFIDFNKAGNIPPSGGVKDPRWLGAWWLGFPPLAAIALCTAPWLLGLPGNTSAQKNAAKEEVKSEAEKEKTDENEGLLGVTDFFKQLWSLVTNPTYVFIVALGTGTNMIFTALNTFGIKYLESQFSLPAGAASLYAGITIVPAGIVGSILGGYLMKKYKMGVAGGLKLNIIGTGFLIFVPLSFLIRCPNTIMAGVTVPYGNGSKPQTPIVGADDVISSCDLGCPCPPAYNPVCGENGVEYFSPCLAGCHNTSGGEKYTSCSCHAGDQPAGVQDGGMFSVTQGHCASGCTLLPLAMLGLFIFSIGSNLSNSPRVVIVLGCVKESQRSFALGVESVIRTFLGSVPSPVVFGALLDRACLLWDENCEQQGACLLYDNALLSSYLAALMAALFFWAFPCSALAFFFWNRKSAAKYEVGDEENEKKI